MRYYAWETIYLSRLLGQMFHQKIRPTRNVIEYLAKQSGKLILQTPCAYEPKIEEQMFWFERNKEGLRCKCFA